jgi:hypothetical protein
VKNYKVEEKEKKINELNENKKDLYSTEIKLNGIKKIKEKLNKKN